MYVYFGLNFCHNLTPHHHHHQRTVNMESRNLLQISFISLSLVKKANVAEFQWQFMMRTSAHKHIPGKVL